MSLKSLVAALLLLTFVVPLGFAQFEKGYLEARASRYAEVVQGDIRYSWACDATEKYTLDFKCVIEDEYGYSTSVHGTVDGFCSYGEMEHTYLDYFELVCRGMELTVICDLWYKGDVTGVRYVAKSKKVIITTRYWLQPECGYCTRDEECQPPLKCIDGRCISPRSKGPFDRCCHDLQCPEDFLCIGGQCQPPAPKGRGASCKSSAECEPGLVCSNGRCLYYKTLPKGAYCFDTIECEEGLTCSGGYCRAIPKACTAYARFESVVLENDGIWKAGDNLVTAKIAGWGLFKIVADFNCDVTIDGESKHIELGTDDCAATRAAVNFYVYVPKDIAPGEYPLCLEIRDVKTRTTVESLRTTVTVAAKKGENPETYVEFEVPNEIVVDRTFNFKVTFKNTITTCDKVYIKIFRREKYWKWYFFIPIPTTEEKVVHDEYERLALGETWIGRLQTLCKHEHCELCFYADVCGSEVEKCIELRATLPSKGSTELSIYPTKRAYRVAKILRILRIA